MNTRMKALIAALVVTLPALFFAVKKLRSKKRSKLPTERFLLRSFGKFNTKGQKL